MIDRRLSGEGGLPGAGLPGVGGLAGALPAREISLEDLPTGSVVYVGRESFRMEAVEGAFEDAAGAIVQAMPRAVTAPYGRREPGENTGVDRLPSSATWRAPDLQSLFGSQDAVTAVLPAPADAVQLPSRRTFASSRAALAALGGVVFACGLAIGVAATHRAPAVRAAASAPPAPAPASAPVIVPSPPPAQAAAKEAEPVTIEVPRAVQISARKRAPARRAAPARAPDAPAKAAAAWVDPFAD